MPKILLPFTIAKNIPITPLNNKQPRGRLAFIGNDPGKYVEWCTVEGTLRNTEQVDLAIAWDWEYDRDFIARTESFAQAFGLRTYLISHHNCEETLRAIQTGRMKIGVYLDRAAETDERFAALSRTLARHGVKYLNSPHEVRRASDKATMHLELITAGIHVPYTIIVSPYNKKRELEFSLSELAHLGRPFIIKPANTTGGGIGVILGAETLKDVIESRQHHKNDKYLLQERIEPKVLDGRKGWFRVFGVCGMILPCWWDPDTHIYSAVTAAEQRRWQLVALNSVTRVIASVCRLDFFSTEIAIQESNTLVAVDYVNEVCDMRLQSDYADGVPGNVVTAIARQLARRTQQLSRGVP